MTAPKCPYCERASVLTDSAAVYGRSYGPIYLCRPCDAYVGCHKGTNKALGRLANKELRQWKIKAHAAFDPLWQRKFAKKRRESGPTYRKCFARNSGYKWLSEQLGIDREHCHIGMFDVEQCKRVVEICQSIRRKDHA